MAPPYFHPTAIVESTQVGDDTRVWAYAHLLPGAVVGRNCNIGDHAFVESGGVLGSNVTLKNHVCVWEGITLEDDVFVGPYACFTNDLRPRSPRMAAAAARYGDKRQWLACTSVGQGATIGANATILGGLQIGRFSFVAAGAVVTGNVDPFALMIGVPARQAGYVCYCGEPLGASIPPDGCPRCEANPISFEKEFKMENTTQCQSR